MKPRYVLLLLAAGLAGCKSGGADPQPAAAPAHKAVAMPSQPAKAESTAVPALPIVPVKQAAPEAKPADAQADARAVRLAAIQQDQETAFDDYRKAFDAALGGKKDPSDDDYKKASEQVPFPDVKGFGVRAQQLLDEDKSDLTAFHTIQWMISTGREPGEEQPLFALLEQYHLERPEMGDLCNQIVRSDRALVEKLAEKSPHVEVRGKACYALAEGLKGDIQTAGYLTGKTQEELDGMKGWLGEEKLAALQKLDVAATEKEIEQIYERVAKEFSDVVVNKGSKRETTLGKQASAALYEIRNLAVGKPTPEIEGVDLDQVAFKLSDYRGKVVLLDFWGNW